MSKGVPVCLSCGTASLPGLVNVVPCGKDAYICRDCAQAALRCIEARGSPGTAPPAPQAATATIPSPSELVAALDVAVIGQVAAKRLLSVALWKHLQRCNGNTAAPNAHMLMYGPTGCGKTHLARTAAKMMDVPFVSVDATRLSSAAPGPEGCGDGWNGRSRSNYFASRRGAEYISHRRF